MDREYKGHELILWEISSKECIHIEESSDELIDKLIKRRARRRALDSQNNTSNQNEKNDIEPFNYQLMDSAKEIPFHFSKKKDCC